MSPNWDLIYRLMTSLYLTLFPGVLCFGYKTVQNVRIQQHYTLISEVFSNLSIAQTNKNKQRRKVSRRGFYQTINDRDMSLRNMVIFGDRQLYTVEAIVRRILFAFRQRPPFQLLAFTSEKTTTNPND